MKKLLMILLALLIPAPAIFAQANQPFCDSASLDVYMTTRQADIDGLNEVFDSLDFSNLGAGFLIVADMRMKYEDMRDVPPCAAYLHQITLMQLSSNQDAITVAILSVFADDEETALYDARIELIGERIARLMQYSAEEQTRLGYPPETNPIPEPNATPEPNSTPEPGQ